MSIHRPGSRGAAARTMKRHTIKNSFWKNHLDNWRLYTAAAGASLAMSTNADADIVYSGPVDQTVSVPAGGGFHSSHKTFSINGNAFRIAVSNMTMFSRSAAAKLISNHGLKFAVQGGGNAINYARGNPIGPNLGSQRSFGTLRKHSSGGGQGGAFGPGTVTGFVGIKTHNGDLGWIQVKVSDMGSSGYPNEAVVIDYAYNSTPGGSITAGETGAVPEPSSTALGLLASGAAGLLAWRQRKAAMTKT